MFSSISLLARSAVVSLAVFASLQAVAIAAPLTPRMDDLALGNGFARPIVDDGGWRFRSYHCCHGGRDGWGARSSGRLGRSIGPRLGSYERYRDNYDRGVYGRRYDEPVYQQQRLSRPRVYQRDSLGGGYYGDHYDDGLY